MVQAREIKRLPQLAHEWNVAVLMLMQLAKRHGISYSPTSEQVDFLRRNIAGYYDLSDLEIRTLEDFLKSDTATALLKEAAPLMDFLRESDQDAYIGYVAATLFDAMDDSPLKRKIRPDTLRETVINLGVIMLYRAPPPEDAKVRLPVHLLGFDPGIAKGVIKAALLKSLERTPLNSAPDFDNARAVLTNAYRELVNYVKG